MVQERVDTHMRQGKRVKSYSREKRGKGKLKKRKRSSKYKDKYPRKVDSFGIFR